ncbi:hypothetical protein T07_10990 [Trichinella nelsoni]|uniref:Uncharacterized protein n=1 Tax=Trichinella nelsoni TaxID=6336 RepID=A0A0V0S1E6_9BILA|nr:hypothetical protein T07_10990 [Trichinella nelsoni]
MCMLSTFFRLSRELGDRETRGYVFCTPLLVTDRLMIIKSIFGGKVFSRKLQNFMGYRLGMYPIVSLHLRIFTTHAIAATSAERSFTTVKYLKSYFRNTMIEERLNGLSVICTFILTFPLILI